MDEKTTRSLSRILENMEEQNDAESFVTEHGMKEFDSFHSFLNAQIADKGLDRADVVKRSGISSNYVYQILSGTKGNPGRDKILALCIASEMNYRQTQRALEIAGLAPLYPRDERDVRIAIAINGDIHESLAVNLILDQYGLPLLDI